MTSAMLLHTAPPLANGSATRPRTLGVLMLETRFPRPLGDIGHPQTFAFPVRRAVVRGASPRRVVHGADPRLLQPFIEAGRRLVDEGADAISTSCGFLVLFQRALQDVLAVPVWTSSLLLLPSLQAALPHGRVAGIVTVDAGALGAAHLRAAGAALDTPIEGLEPGCAFQRALLDDEVTFDLDDACAATVAAAQALQRRRPDLGAIVLECTNMPPYADAVRAATGLPVHDITTLLASRFGIASVVRPVSP
ncbi:MAG: aspartate/glutamate racemase family protein [Caldimonas sp.]